MSKICPDLSFPESETYVLVIDTNQYSGNFERELCEYCTGIRSFDSPISTELDQVKTSLVDISTSVEHDEYGEVNCAIAITPGRLNDGYGTHRDAAEGEKGYPAYESVAIFFEEPLDKVQLDYITEQAKNWAKKYGKNLEIKDIYMLKVSTQVTIIDNEQRLKI